MNSFIYKEADDSAGRVLLGTGMVMLVAGYLAGLRVPLMDNDSAYHALISLKMMESGNYAELYYRGADYLDKPHFLFWITALSMRVFGVCAWAYKLPALLFSALGIYATYRVGARLWSRQCGQLAAVILSGTYAFFLANNDVRMDAILTACIIVAIWKFVAWTHSGKFLNMVFCAMAMATGFSTKGAIGIAMPVIFAVMYLIHTNTWTILKRFRWLAFGMTTVVFMLPVFYCMYSQFDMHPEKVLHGVSHNSGVLFMLVGQSLGRYGGTVWGTSASHDPFFFTHTLLWAFIPWSLAAILSMWTAVKDVWIHRTRSVSFPLVGTFLLIFVLISGSQFKLPHYLNILFPLLALLTARGITSVSVSQKMLRVSQYVSVIILIAIVGLLNIYVFPVAVAWLRTVVMLSAIGVLVCVIVWRDRFVVLTIFVTGFCYAWLNLNFYPELLELQGGNSLAECVEQGRIPIGDIVYLQDYEMHDSFDFSLGSIIPAVPLKNVKQAMYIVTGEGGKEALHNENMAVEQLYAVQNFKVSKMSKIWIVPATRTAYTNRLYLFRVLPVLPASD